MEVDGGTEGSSFVTGRYGDSSPLYKRYSELIGSPVSVVCADLSRISGLLYVIDPPTGTVVLLKTADKDGNTVCFPPVAEVLFAVDVREVIKDDNRVEIIKSWLESSKLKCESSSLEVSPPEYESKVMLMRKRALIKLFNKRRVEVIDLGSDPLDNGGVLPGLSLFDGELTVQVPFSGNSCLRSKNEVILARMRTFLSHYWEEIETGSVSG